MADPYNSTTTTRTKPDYTNPANPNATSTNQTTHIRESQKTTNWFAWLLGGAVVAVAIIALVFSGDRSPNPTAGGNSVTIENPAAAPSTAPATAPAADTAVAPPATDAPAATTPAPEPAAPAGETTAPGVDPAAPAPAGN
jgi:hypothetical protein